MELIYVHVIITKKETHMRRRYTSTSLWRDWDFSSKR